MCDTLLDNINKCQMDKKNGTDVYLKLKVYIFAAQGAFRRLMERKKRTMTTWSPKEWRY